MKRNLKLIPPKHITGFTLVELLVVVVIFALIGLGCYQLLVTLSSTKERNNQLWSNLAADNRLYILMKNDLSQMVAQPTRNQYGDPLPAFLADSVEEVEFTRHGWRKNLPSTKSELVRVSYSFENNKMIRRYWFYLGKPLDSDAVEQVVLRDIESVKFNFLDEHGKWSQSWPPENVSKKTALTILPRVVAIVLEKKDNQTIRWLVQGPDILVESNKGP